MIADFAQITSISHTATKWPLINGIINESIFCLSDLNKPKRAFVYYLLLRINYFGGV